LDPEDEIEEEDSEDEIQMDDLGEESTANVVNPTQA